MGPEERRLFDYCHFGFNDENWRNRQIGLERPQVLLFCEKAGQIRLLSQLGERLGVSFVALGGVVAQGDRQLLQACSTHIELDELGL